MAQAPEPIVVEPRGPRRGSLWVGLALLLVAAGLRPPVASVGPVLEELRRGVGLSSGAAGALTTLPILCFGLGGLLALALVRRWGAEVVVLASLAAIVLGSLARTVPEVLPVFGGTLVIGLAIGVANVLLPGVIKRDYRRPGRMMGPYTMVLTGAPALGVALTVPLEHALGSWELALAASALPALGGFVAWAPAVRRARRGVAIEPEAVPRGLLRDRTAWVVTGFMGLQSLLFYALLSWLPAILRDSGVSPARAGVMLSLFVVFGLPGNLLAPMAAARLADQRPVVLVGVAVWAVGLLGLLLAPSAGAPAWMVMLGLGQGTALGLSLTLILLRAPDRAHVAALSGMAQSFGYVLAAAGPFAVGLSHQFTGAWTAAIVLLLAVTVVELATGLAASRPAMVGARGPGASIATQSPNAPT